MICNLSQFYGLDAGWDGGEAAAPALSAIEQATRFVRALRFSGVDADPALDVDGSVVLELDNGSLKFKGDGNVVFAFDCGNCGVVPLDGVRIPDALRSITLRRGSIVDAKVSGSQRTGMGPSIDEVRLVFGIEAVRWSKPKLSPNDCLKARCDRRWLRGQARDDRSHRSDARRRSPNRRNLF